MRTLLLSLTCAFILGGCFEQPSVRILTQEEQNEKTRSELAVFKDIKESYINGREKADRYNLYVPQSYYSEYPDLSVTLPFVYGAKLEMDREHYMIRRYSNRVLLYSNYGIKDRFNMTYSDVGDYGRLQELGFNSFGELYLFVFDKLTSYPLKESYDFIKELEKAGVVDSDEVLNFSRADKRNEDYIRNLFSNYFDFEKESFQNTDIDESLSHWYLSANDKLITLSKDEFKIYSLTDFIVKKALKSNKPLSLKQL